MAVLLLLEKRETELDLQLAQELELEGKEKQ
jgi:hypothetical protein